MNTHTCDRCGEKSDDCIQDTSAMGGADDGWVCQPCAEPEAPCA